MAANNDQVQNWSDTRTRPRAEQARAYIASLDGDTGPAFDDVYANLTNSPTWDDERVELPSPPPNELTPSDLLAIHTFNVDVRDFAKAHAGWPIIQKACVQPVNVEV